MAPVPLSMTASVRRTLLGVAQAAAKPGPRALASRAASTQTAGAAGPNGLPGAIAFMGPTARSSGQRSAGGSGAGNEDRGSGGAGQTHNEGDPKQQSQRITFRFFLTDGILKAALTSGILYGLGDAMAQLIVEPYATNRRREALARLAVAKEGSDRPQNSPPSGSDAIESSADEGAAWDPRRTANFMIAGGLIHGPYFSRVYLLLDAFWPHLSSKASIGKRLLTGLKKSLATNFFIGPPFLVGFLAFVSHLEGLNWEEIKAKINRLGPVLFIDGLKAWPIASALNFAFTPPPYRLAVVNVIGAFWNSYVSVKNADKVSLTLSDDEELQAATMLGAEMVGMGHLDAVAAHHEKVNKTK